MRIELTSGATRMMTVRRLSFPFEVIYRNTGPMWYVKEGITHHVDRARKAKVAPLTTIDIGLPDETTASVKLIRSPVRRNAKTAQTCEAGGLHEPDEARPCSRAWTLAAALQVFRNPQQQWSKAQVASTLGLSEAELSRKLFAEGECVRHIVHTQRLMRLFADLGRIGRIDDELARKYGFLHRRQLERAFAEHFGMGLVDVQAALCKSPPLSSFARQLLHHPWSRR